MQYITIDFFYFFCYNNIAFKNKSLFSVEKTFFIEMYARKRCHSNAGSACFGWASKKQLSVVFATRSQPSKKLAKGFTPDNQRLCDLTGDADGDAPAGKRALRAKKKNLESPCKHWRKALVSIDFFGTLLSQNRCKKRFDHRFDHLRK